MTETIYRSGVDSARRTAASAAEGVSDVASRTAETVSDLASQAQETARKTAARMFPPGLVDGPNLPGSARGRQTSYGAPKSGSLSEPSAPSGKPGLNAISQMWPSGSAKKPAYPP